MKFELRPGLGAEFDRLVEETLVGIRQREPGTLLYLCHEVDEEPDARIFYELYQDPQAFERHEQQPHVRRFLEERERLLARPPRVEFVRSGLGKAWPGGVS